MFDFLCLNLRENDFLCIYSLDEGDLDCVREAVDVGDAPLGGDGGGEGHQGEDGETHLAI